MNTGLPLFCHSTFFVKKSQNHIYKKSFFLALFQENKNHKKWMRGWFRIGNKLHHTHESLLSLLSLFHMEITHFAFLQLPLSPYRYRSLFSLTHVSGSSFPVRCGHSIWNVSFPYTLPSLIRHVASHLYNDAHIQLHASGFILKADTYCCFFIEQYVLLQYLQNPAIWPHLEPSETSPQLTTNLSLSWRW
jgi:hypothetical protein